MQNKIERNNRLQKNRNLDSIAPIEQKNWESNDCIIELQNTSKNNIKQNHLLINYLRN
jgi:hypothetical protein